MLKYAISSIADTDIKTYKDCFSMMNCEKQEKIKRLKNTDQQKLSLLGEWLAKSLISEFYGTDIKEIIFTTDEKGKPYCKNFPIHFNISHSVDTACAVISDNPIGIDIEKIRPVSLKLTRRLCTEDELSYIFGHIPEESDYNINFPDAIYNRFFEIWTAKEAYFKYIGTGITNFKSIDVLTSPIDKTKYETNDYIIHIVQQKT